jgi:hypothetical protein
VKSFVGWFYVRFTMALRNVAVDDQLSCIQGEDKVVQVKEGAGLIEALKI